MTVTNDDSVSEAIYQIRSHLLYELKWMIFAASRFQTGQSGDVYVALIDSATVHARALFEFGNANGRHEFSLASLGGTRTKAADWDHWANNRVMHMTYREHNRAGWPDGLDNDRVDRFMVMAGAVLKRLENGGQSIPSGPIKTAYDQVVRSARQYWSEPTERRHNELSALYDDSRDNRGY